MTDADFNATPLRWAIHGSEHRWHAAKGDYAGVVEALLRAGASRPTSIEDSPPVRRALERGRDRQARRRRLSGRSHDGLGSDFRPFEINGLE